MAPTAPVPDSPLARAGFNFVFIDCPAGIDIGFLNAIAPAREAIIVTTPEITSIRDADRVAGLLEANGVFNVKLLVNRVRADMIKKNDMMSVRDVQEMLGVPLLGAIPEATNVIISTNRGEPLVLKKKLTLAGIAYENAGAWRARRCAVLWRALTRQGCVRFPLQRGGWWGRRTS